MFHFACHRVAAATELAVDFTGIWEYVWLLQICSWRSGFWEDTGMSKMWATLCCSWIFGLLITCGLCALSSPATGATLQTAVVSKTQPSLTTCTAPPSDTSFSAADSTVYEYFLIQ